MAQPWAGYRKQTAHKPCWEYGYKNTGSSLTTSKSNNKSHWCGLNWMAETKTRKCLLTDHSKPHVHQSAHLRSKIATNFCSCGNCRFCNWMRTRLILRCYTMSQENSENSELLDNLLCILHCEQTVKCHISAVGLQHKILCMQRNADIQQNGPKITGKTGQLWKSSTSRSEKEGTLEATAMTAKALLQQKMAQILTKSWVPSSSMPSVKAFLHLDTKNGYHWLAYLKRW